MLRAASIEWRGTAASSGCHRSLRKRWQRRRKIKLEREVIKGSHQQCAHWFLAADDLFRIAYGRKVKRHWSSRRGINEASPREHEFMRGNGHTAAPESRRVIRWSRSSLRELSGQRIGVPQPDSTRSRVASQAEPVPGLCAANLAMGRQSCGRLESQRVKSSQRIQQSCDYDVGSSAGLRAEISAKTDMGHDVPD